MRLTGPIGIRPWFIGPLLSAAGMFLGYEMGSGTAELLGGEPGIWARLGKGLTWGGVIAALQWPVVRATGVRPFRFVVTSAVCFAAGYPLGQSIQGIFVGQWGLHWTGFGSALATFGLCLGLPQWWIFRRQLPRANLWIPLSVAGWMLAGATMSGPRIDVLAAGMYGIAAGLGLVWLSRFQRPGVTVNTSDESSQ